MQSILGGGWGGEGQSHMGVEKGEGKGGRVRGEGQNGIEDEGGGGEVR